MSMSVEEVREAVVGLDPNLEPDSGAFRIATAMLAAVVLGSHDVNRIAAFTGVPRKEVGEAFGRLRAQRVFRGTPNDPQFAVGWFDEEDGGIAFWCDVLVAQGLLAKAWS